MATQSSFGRALERISHRITVWTGSSWAFLAAAAGIVAWGASGPVFGFSDTWQLVVNTSTTIITFLMVFLIQRSQNKDSRAVHLKLNEIIAAMEGASNRLVDIEELSEDDLGVLHKYYAKLSAMAKRDVSLTKSHSIDEAEHGHRSKLKARPHLTSKK
jgi:low affinity Fe/Cu permease